jgi:hypothetical protein
MAVQLYPDGKHLSALLGWPTLIVTPHHIGWDKQYETMQQKTKEKNQPNYC